VSRTQFHEYKRRFQAHAIEGLKDLPPIHKTHPEVVEHLLELGLFDPLMRARQIEKSDVLVHDTAQTCLIDYQHLGFSPRVHRTGCRCLRS